MDPRRSLALSLAPLAMVACGGAAASPGTNVPMARPPSSAGDVTASAEPDRSADEIAALRAQGPAALDALLADYDRAPNARLAATIDKVAGQRFATVSRLYWYTDLDAAKAAAHATFKPILSLRMLGRLDEDLSCANSRFFRTILYANAELAPWLRDHFILYWSSERPVPKITIDYGDGRVLERTITGNSAHFVLDADGRPLDVLPGLYAPSAFKAELTQSLALAARVASLEGRERSLALAAYHRDRAGERRSSWEHLGAVPVIFGRSGLLAEGDVQGALATAQRATVSKAAIEVPDLRIVDVGADPGAIAPDLELWAVIGQRLYGWGAPAAVAPAAPEEMRYAGRFGTEPAPRREPPHAPPKPLHLLDARSTALVLALVSSERPGVPALGAAEKAAVLARLDQTLAADSAQNELVLRTQIHDFMAWREPDFEMLDAFVYGTVFHTPAEDPWLGLLPRDAFTGLPADGVTIER